MNSQFIQINTLLVHCIVFTTLFSLQITLGQQNNALDFSNANFLEHGDFVYLGSPDYGLTNKLTVAVWFKWTADPQSVLTTNHESEGRYANLVTSDRHNALNDGQFWLQHSKDNSKYQFDVRTSEKKNVQTSTISNSADEGRWYYLVGVYDDAATSSLKIYLNGELEESSNELSGNINAYDSDDRLTFGRVPSGYRMFTGNLDEIRIWNTALTQSEIRQQMFSRQTVAPSGLKSYWSMDQSEGTLVEDSGPQNADGVFYSSLVDVHSFTTNPGYTISDDDKDWVLNSWAGLPINTVAGDGVDETNTVASNTAYILTIENAWITTPIIDGQTNMTWYGIEDTSENAQWVLSTCPASDNNAFINTTTPTLVGPAGAEMSVTITSIPSSYSNLGAYQLGSLNGPAITSETFPSGIDKRANLLWGVTEWSSVTATLQFSYTNIPGVVDPSQLVLLRRTRDTNTWYDAGGTNDVGNKNFTLTGITSFYEYSIGANSFNPLPVELSLFKGKYLKSEKCVLLNWRTQTEVNNYGFEIEQSADKINWHKIGFVAGYGNSNSPKEYNFRDRNLYSTLLYYRLKQVDTDGFSSLSHVVELNISLPEIFEVSQNYPNPFNPSTTIKFSIPESGNTSIKVYNLLGSEVATLLNEIKQPGTYEVNFDAAGLPSGTYFYSMESGNFREVRKMILMK